MTFGTGFFLAAATFGFATCATHDAGGAGVVLLLICGVIAVVSEAVARLGRATR